MTWTRPAGIPASSSSWTPSSGDSAVLLSGLSTTPLPAISAGIVSETPVANGKFHGAMIATTPLGRRTSVELRQERHRAGVLAVLEQLGSALDVVAGAHRDVAGLFERHPAVLAALGLDDVGDEHLVVDHERWNFFSTLRRFLIDHEPQIFWAARASAYACDDVARRRLRQLDQQIAGVDLGQLPGVAGAAGYALDQAVEELRRQAWPAASRRS